MTKQKPTTNSRIKFIARFIICTVLFVPIYPILVYAISFFGITFIFGSVVFLGKFLSFLIGNGSKNDLNESVSFLFAPLILPFVMWYEYVFNLKVILINE